jgi:hypothetical protein
MQNIKIAPTITTEQFKIFVDQSYYAQAKDIEEYRIKDFNKKCVTNLAFSYHRKYTVEGIWESGASNKFTIYKAPKGRYICQEIYFTADKNLDTHFVAICYTVEQVKEFFKKGQQSEMLYKQAQI